MASSSGGQCAGVRIKCYFHREGIDDEAPIIITEARFLKVVACTKLWIGLDSHNRTIADNLVSELGILDEGKTHEDVIQQHPYFGFHPVCYRRYIDTKAIALAEKRMSKKRAMETTDETIKPAKHQRKHFLRSKSDISQTTTILPQVCIICKKKDKRVNKNHKYSCRQKLRKAQTDDAGMLRNAAEVRKDEELLKHIHEKSCACIEVRYHDACYKDYTKIVVNTRYRNNSGKLSKTFFEQHCKGYTAFCEKIINVKMKDGLEIIRLTKLQKYLAKHIQEEENIELGSVRADLLKAKLQKDFPSLIFHMPTKRNESTIVYFAEVSPGVVVEKFVSQVSSTDESEHSDNRCSSAENIGTEADYHDSKEKLRTLYLAGLILKNAIKSLEPMNCLWPPRACDIDNVVMDDIIPYQLFNILAICTGIVDEHIEPHMAKVPEEIRCKLEAICQDIVYLASKGRRQMPKSLALGLTVRHMTGSTHLLQILSKFGHCSSPDTIISYETSLAMLRMSTAHMVPDGFKRGQLVTMVWDNIDFNEETVSGEGTTHHTNGIMLQVKKGDAEATSIDRPRIKKGIRKFQHIPSELHEYHRVSRVGPACEVDVNNLSADKWKTLLTPSKVADFVYLMTRLYGDAGVPGWTGYNIITQKYSIQKTAIHYLPVIEASATDLTTINTIIYKSVEMAERFLLQHVVCVFDQAIYAKVQEIRWADENLKKRLVVRLGEFHTCMSYMSIIGKRFGDAGLKDILVEAGVVAGGSINGVISGHHYNRAIHTYKIVYEAFGNLRFSAFLESLDERQYDSIMAKISAVNWSDDIDDNETIDDICKHYEEFITTKRKDDPLFDFWSSFLDMVSLLLTFIRATRTSDWELHLGTIRMMLPWFYAYDRANYARYLPAYWTEMVQLEKTHPTVYYELCMPGSWTVQRQDLYPFASIACDQAIEETLNRDCKIQGGIKRFTLNRAAVQRWLLAQPERAEIARTCERMSGYEMQHRDPKELDSTRIKMVKELVESVKCTTCSMINPFTSAGEDLVNISSGAIATEKVRADLSMAYDIGQQEAEDFLKTRICSTGSKSLFATVKQKKLKTFKDNYNKTSKLSNSAMVKGNKALYSRLLVVGQARGIDMKDVMSYCLGDVPFPLANGPESLVKTDKSALLKVIEGKGDETIYTTKPPADGALMIDAMALIQSFSKRNIADTIEQLAMNILKQVQSIATSYKCSRVDFVCDKYPLVSIKNLERAKRAGSGSEIIKIYGQEQKTPKQYKKFLSNGRNKEALIEYCFETWSKSANIDVPFPIFVTHGSFCHKLIWADGVCNAVEIPQLFCDHEEADTRLILHAKHASYSHTSVIIRSPDTDVAILALSHAENISSQIYFMTGHNNTKRIINMNMLADIVGLQFCRAVIGLHVFTGCDSTSAFYGKGKKKAVDVVMANTEYLKVFEELGSTYTISNQMMSSLERFVCLLYGHKGMDKINEARYLSFCKTASEKCLPPCRDALVQHIKRCNYQSLIYRSALIAIVSVQSPKNHGWDVNDTGLSVVWMTQDPAPQSLMEIIKCSCKTGCSQGRCQCNKMNMKCSDLCQCTNCQKKY